MTNVAIFSQEKIITLFIRLTKKIQPTMEIDDEAKGGSRSFEKNWHNCALFGVVWAH